jgi:hypothetical protein
MILLHDPGEEMGGAYNGCSCIVATAAFFSWRRPPFLSHKKWSF